MAFPGTYNIKYYKGDTFEFRIFPKTPAGTPFPLTNYSSVRFSIATARGSSTIIQGFAEVSDDGQSVNCAITPAVSASLLTQNSPYVYDVEIGRDSEPYDFVYTLLTGTITLTEQVTPLSDIVTEVTVTIPNNPTTLTSSVTNNSISIGWVEPITGDAPDQYNLYILPYTLDVNTITAALAGTPTATVDAPATGYTFTGLNSETEYLVGVIASNSAGPASTLTALTNLGVPIVTAPDLPNSPTDLQVGFIGSSAFGVSWTAPVSGGTVENYKLYIMPYTTDPNAILAAYLAGPTDTIAATQTSHVFFELQPETDYLVAIVSSNATGDSSLETALTNLLTGPITTTAEES